MAKHLPTVVWMLNRKDGYPYGFVQTADEENISLYYFTSPGRGEVLTVPRHAARMFARRIHQCLEETKA